jgi:hypothetical protein
MAWTPRLFWSEATKSTVFSRVLRGAVGDGDQIHVHLAVSAIVPYRLAQPIGVLGGKNSNEIVGLSCCRLFEKSWEEVYI